MVVFQSTLSSRRATRQSGRLRYCRMYFNPRSPHGERLLSRRRMLPKHRFQSTLSSRRATSHIGCVSLFVCISIHALLTESDAVSVNIRGRIADFNPRSPHGERPVANPCVLSGYLTISIHALLTESDRYGLKNRIKLLGFQSTLSSRRATAASRPSPADSS